MILAMRNALLERFTITVLILYSDARNAIPVSMLGMNLA